MKYVKGNTHCHSSRSDGELPPAEVAQYYHSIDYDFLAITDHHSITLSEEYDIPSKIAGITSVEIGSLHRVHTVGLWCNSESYQPVSDEGYEAASVGEVLQRNIDAICVANGVPIVCHPFWYWTFDYDRIKEVTGWKHFELCNASPDCNSIPIPGYAPAEEFWDSLLSNGRRVFGVASDDAHNYSAPYTPNKPLGGRGFIMLKAEDTSQHSLREAFEEGHFYSSTGTLLKRYILTDTSIQLEVDISSDNEACSIEFFGHHGTLLYHTIESKAEYKFKGDEVYVRARIATTLGHWLWTQPVFLDDLQKQQNWINV